MAGELERELGLLLRRAQAERVPSIAAGVVRGRETVWSEALGLARVDPEEPATLDHQYRIGSITKTFTAVAVMQLRDAGALDLEDPLSLHVADAPKGAATVRRLLSHLSGLQREPPGSDWEALHFPAGAAAVASLADAEQVLPPGARWHYSNLAFTLLGEVVARASGVPYRRYLEERILAPLGLSRTTFRPVPPVAAGYLVDAYSDTVRAEPQLEETGDLDSAGALWSTVGDLCRWGAFLADPDPAVLARETVDEMAVVQAIADHERWTLGWGLGLELCRRGERILCGHGGAMPGFLAGLLVAREERVAAAVLQSSGATGDPDELAASLVTRTLELEPPAPQGWRVGEPPPPELEGVLGRWWSEGSEFVFSWRSGRLEARAVGAPRERPPAAFRREQEDRYRTVSGREIGELMQIVRGDTGEVVRLYWATYPFTRAPETFGQSSP
jgi:CubicO group peptidase (beta-lactamase class C family)